MAERESLPGEGPGLTHLDERGQARMVDVGHKPVTSRMARAQARLLMKESTWQLLQAGGLPKGDALAVARVAGIMAAKETSRLIPLCHPVPLSSVEVHIHGPAPGEPAREGSQVAVLIEAVARTVAQTGVEMEALTAASVAALALYDMCKAHDREMVVERLALVEKTGGQRGDYRRQEV